MNEKIGVLEAKRLRAAFRATKDDDSNKGILCDRVWVFGAGHESNHAQILCLEFEGRPVAWIPITNGVLKRLKGEFGHWRRIGSGGELRGPNRVP